MSKRLFVFGCSMTSYSYGTWADLISANFDEYYNYGRAGASNVFIMNRLIEANERYKFNENDYVMVMTTGIGRYSYYKEKWFCHGDLYPYLSINKNKILESFVKDMWDDNYAVYLSWTALNVVQNILKHIPHKIFIGVNNDEYLKNNVISNDSVKKVKNIMSLGVNNIPFDQWFRDPKNIPNDVKTPTEIYKIDNIPDGHPSQRMHYEFIKKFLPQYNNQITENNFKYIDSIFDGTNQSIQEEIFKKLFKSKFDKAMSDLYLSDL